MVLTPRNFFAIVALVLASSLLAGCQVATRRPAVGPPAVMLPRTEMRLLRSNDVRGVTYKLYVGLPRGYQDDRRYPVVYLLDADYSFAIARAIVEQQGDVGQLPPVVLVGIAYDGPPRYHEHRTRDYTPTHVPVVPSGSEAQRYSGGGPAFRQFLAEELIPFVERTYRVTNERTLVGHSFGGLFGTWIAFTMPELFASYLLVSPALWYDDRMIFGVEQAFAATREALPVQLYFAAGELEVNSLRNMPGDLREFTTRIQRRGYRGLRQRAEVLDDETHNSVFPRALSNGLRMILSRAPTGSVDGRHGQFPHLSQHAGSDGPRSFIQPRHAVEEPAGEAGRPVATGHEEGMKRSIRGVAPAIRFRPRR